MECVLTTLSLSRAPGGGGAQLLRAAEQARATSILQRALRAEHSHAAPAVTEEHPDGREYQAAAAGRRAGARRLRHRGAPRCIQTYIFGQVVEFQ